MCEEVYTETLLEDLEEALLDNTAAVKEEIALLKDIKYQLKALTIVTEGIASCMPRER